VCLENRSCGNCCETVLCCVLRRAEASASEEVKSLHKKPTLSLLSYCVWTVADCIYVVLEFPS
jgi:hypothetical protein